MAITQQLRIDRPARRLPQLFLGLALFGFGAALQLKAGLGLDPWGVLHQGLSIQTGLSIGTWVILMSLVVLVLWIPLRQRPGWGTVANTLTVGLFLDGSLWILPTAHTLIWQILMVIGAVVITGLASGLYIGADLGTGPRDGLMTGLARRGLSLRVARTGVELTVLVAGWLLGGQVGVATVVFAVAIGPVAQVFIHRLMIRP
ncbi:hypothetical protein D5S17_07550 [Pseudonocardiaceae bacterium YIM PH 21723]|nr:hypothetical protein D5S17_07550 [Pseudonocardiaceae bacterium YIM PH 21723]